MSFVGISIELIRELTLCVIFAGKARGLRSLFSGQTFFFFSFFYRVEGWAYGVEGSLKLVSDYGGPRKEQSCRNQTSKIWIFLKFQFLFDELNRINTISKFQNLTVRTNIFDKYVSNISNLATLWCQFLIFLFGGSFLKNNSYVLCLMSYVKYP